jgi:hypothetical protein
MLGVVKDVSDTDPSGGSRIAWREPPESTHEPQLQGLWEGHER